MIHVLPHVTVKLLTSFKVIFNVSKKNDVQHIAMMNILHTNVLIIFRSFQMFKNIFKQKSKNRSHLEYANQFIAPVKKMRTPMV